MGGVSVKKLSLLALVLSVVLLTACEGDDPAGPGTLATVTGLEVLSTSAGQTVVLSWTIYSGTETIDGYEVYFKTEGEGSWVALGTTTATGYEDIATVAGTYSVRAYEGDNYSTEYAIEASTMPVTATGGPYTIWDNHAPVAEHSGFMFGSSSGTTGLATDPAFHQDIYCYDGGWTESPCGFYSGNEDPFPQGGNDTDMIEVQGGHYGYPSGTSWWPKGFIVANDVIFAELYDGYFVKIYVESVPQHTTQPASHGIVFTYEWQPISGLSLFTDNTN